VYVPVTKEGHRAVESVTMTFDGAAEVTAALEGSRLVLHRSGSPDSIAPFADRGLGDLLAEELRRLDVDEIYADALGTVTSQKGLNERPPQRVHIWNDPASAAS
jgi:glucose-6-phosphate dehydrogenase assembly protein OpcA